MIENERQYQITKDEADKFQEAITNLGVVEGGLSAEMRRIMCEAMESQLQELREQLADYDARRSKAQDPEPNTR
jgi:HPt (histidine-containing phosphotransfer) domain-containing protein